MVNQYTLSLDTVKVITVAIRGICTGSRRVITYPINTRSIAVVTVGISSTYSKRFLKETTVGKSKYKHVVLAGLGSKAVHRLVAAAFLPNPEGLPIVNHKDGNPANNVVEKLEWCTHSYNNYHAVKTGLYVPSKRWKGVIQYNCNHNEIRRWRSVKEATASFEGSPDITRVCDFPYGMAAGFIWRFDKEPIDTPRFPTGKVYRDTPLILFSDGRGYCTRRNSWLKPKRNRSTKRQYFLYYSNGHRKIWLDEALPELFS